TPTPSSCWSTARWWSAATTTPCWPRRANTTSCTTGCSNCRNLSHSKNRPLCPSGGKGSRFSFALFHFGKGIVGAGLVQPPADHFQQAEDRGLARQLEIAVQAHIGHVIVQVVVAQAGQGAAGAVGDGHDGAPPLFEGLGHGDDLLGLARHRQG